MNAERSGEANTLTSEKRVSEDTNYLLTYHTSTMQSPGASALQKLLEKMSSVVEKTTPFLRALSLQITKKTNGTTGVKNYLFH